MICEHEKMSVKQAVSQWPFLKTLFDESGITLQKKVRVTFRIDEPIDLIAPFHDGCCRYTSKGTVNEIGLVNSQAHYAGTYDSCLCNRTEVLGEGLNDKIVKENCYYAVFDWFEHWKSRHVTVWVRSAPLLKEVEYEN